MTCLSLSANARNAMHLANQEALNFRHEYIGTEHMLLGVFTEASGAGVAALRRMGITESAIRAEVASRIKPGPVRLRFGPQAQTPRMEQVVAYAVEEARVAGEPCVGTGHILIGLARERGGVAALILSSLGVTLEQTRDAITTIGVTEATSTESMPTATASTSIAGRASRWLRRLVR